MSNQVFNRRSWLKKTALFSGGVAFAPGLFASPAGNHVSPAFSISGFPLLDNDLALETTPPEIKSRLSANENPFGPSLKARQAMADSLTNGYRYAFFEGRKMEALIVAHEGVKKEQLFMSAGSGALLEAGAKIFTEGKIISSQPTYEDLLQSAEAIGTKVIRVPLTTDYHYDLDAMEKLVDDTTGLVYICNPNNPTATLLDREKLKAFCRRVAKKTTVMVDEAYIDFVKDADNASVISLVKEGLNIVVLRTFSKLYGMAGLRFGYLVGQPDVVKKFREVSPGSGSVACTTWAAAIASYQDKAFMAEVNEKMQASKDYLYKVLKEEGYKYVPSEANFVIFPIKEEGKTFATKMMNNGVSVRTWAFDNKNWCRVSIGTMDEMKVFALALVKSS